MYWKAYYHLTNEDEMNKTNKANVLPHIELSGYKKIKFEDGYGGSQPYVMCFVYPKGAQPRIVSGMCAEVHGYVREHFPMSFYHTTYWQNGKSRGMWGFTAKHRYMSQGRDGRYEISIYDGCKFVRKLSLKRMPHKWIPEFDIDIDDDKGA
jgi:hypothetical protein